MARNGDSLAYEMKVAALGEKSHNPISRPMAAPWLAIPPSRNPVMMVHGFGRDSIVS